jgi:hypothetical protein
MALYLIAFLHARAAAREKTGDDALFATTAAAVVIVVAAHGLLLSLYVEPIYTLVVSCVVGLAMASAAGLRRSVWPWRTTERRG